MSVSLDEQRFSRVYADAEPDFIEMPADRVATRRPVTRSRSQAARQQVNWLADDPPKQAPKRDGSRFDLQTDLRARGRRKYGWISLLTAVFTVERSTGYAISVTVHLFLVLILSLFLIGGSDPTPRVVIDSTFVPDTPAVSEPLEDELSLPPARLETVPMTLDSVPIIGDVESLDGDGLGRFHGDGGAGFFGLRAAGRDIVYIVDCSGSMQGQPFARARRELLDSINELESDQRLYVMFYSNSPYLMFNESGPPGALLEATDANKQRVWEWVLRIDAGGSTHPKQALYWALGLDPDAVFFLTDGRFDEIVDDVTSANSGGTRIHTISFMNEAGEEQLRRIADENGGTYRFVP